MFFLKLHLNFQQPATCRQFAHMLFEYQKI